MRDRLIGPVVSLSFPGMDETSTAPDSRPLRFGPVNAVLAVLGIACLVGGYALLAQGSITAAPILLVVGYVGFLPAAILK